MHQISSESSDTPANTDFKYAAASGSSSAPTSIPLLIRGAVEESLKQAKAIGFDGLEIHLRDPDGIDGPLTKDACDAHEMRISALVTGMGYTVDELSLIHPVRSARQEAVNRLESYVNLADQLDCLVVIGLMRGNIPDVASAERYLQYLRDSLSQLMEVAHEKNVIVAMEAINRYEVNYLNTVEDVLELIHRVDSPLFKVHIDTFHMNIEEKDIITSIEQCGRQLGYVHYADSNRKAPGRGHLDFKRISEALKSVSYNGFIAFEHFFDKDPYAEAAQGLAHVKQIGAGMSDKEWSHAQASNDRQTKETG